MVTEKLVCEINNQSKNIDKNKILDMGDVFSGYFYHDESNNSWTQFNLVNKEKMSYILNGVTLNKGARFEIQIYVRNTKKI
tara:strand:+ start:8 stop:250 length:243 start_codon:yes stop_codon:yes gene_type:complete